MTKIISILNQKGGCGKTTLAINVAHSFLRKGYKTLLVDSDPQGSARDWGEINNGEIIPIVGLDRESLINNIKAIQNAYDIIIIDGAPSIAKLSIAAVKISDVVLIPVQPSPWDIWATSELVNIVKTRREIADNKPEVFFVISRVIKNTKFAKEVIEALKDYEIPILKSSTAQRMVYPSSASEGSTVFSCASGGGDAVNEIEGITNEIIEVINGVKN